MEDSLLIDGFATDTNREEWLDDVYVATDPAAIARMCTDYGRRVTLIDPGDPHHFGSPERVGGPAPAADVEARNTVLQAAALGSSSTPRPPDVSPAEGTDYSPGIPGR